MKSASQMKLNPSITPDEVGFHHVSDFIPRQWDLFRQTTDLAAPTKKGPAIASPFFVGARDGT